MKALQVLVFDDLELWGTGEKVKADETVTLGWGGKWVELDLTSKNANRLYEAIADFIAAGHPPGEGLMEPVRSEGGAYAYYRQLREWADSQGRSDEYHAKGTKGGKPSGFSYNKKLREDYKKHLLSLAQ